MRSYAWLAVALLLASLGVGCQSTGGANTASARPADYGYSRVGAGRSFVERHPLLYEPYLQYQHAGPNPVAKVLTGAASVPLGIVKEANQIITGR